MSQNFKTNLELNKKTDIIFKIKVSVLLILSSDRKIKSTRIFFVVTNYNFRSNPSQEIIYSSFNLWITQHSTEIFNINFHSSSSIKSGILFDFESFGTSEFDRNTLLQKVIWL